MIVLECILDINIQFFRIDDLKLLVEGNLFVHFNL